MVLKPTWRNGRTCVEAITKCFDRFFMSESLVS